MKCFEKTGPESHYITPAPKFRLSSVCLQGKQIHRGRCGDIPSCLSHLEKQGSYVRMLFVDYGSAFHTILPPILVGKLDYLGLPHSTCMDEVERLSGWCKENNLLLNTTKTKKLIIDYRRKETDITPLYISGDCVERVADFQFLGVQIEEGLTWSTNTSELLKKAQQRLYFLRALRKNNVTQRLLVSFYRCSIESIL
ncbi:hypothetical protein QTP86_021585, partial [Hemibagrus guttatus]